jgi:aspartate carbamoyltransferase catalytic subunit
VDLYTIYLEKGQIDDIRILVYGDLEHARTISSLVTLLSHFKVELIQVDLREKINPDLLANVDVLYMTRPQTERHLKQDEKYYGLEAKMLPTLNRDAMIMHPLPRSTELPEEVDKDPRVVFFKQMKYGVAMRQAILRWILSSCL